ncbi:hypothetical protein PS704_04027 [Pseudomonas fluorescens]|uniref:Uncharacterized protein n=1 Tax=Pseudomonas fluorescens TaxID=294 RepID=A0A5E7DM42_PSEFL|nr:hypothetical protein PS704_04027 [Pseudomonas fluorescens]
MPAKEGGRFIFRKMKNNYAPLFYLMENGTGYKGTSEAVKKSQ